MCSRRVTIEGVKSVMIAEMVANPISAPMIVPACPLSRSGIAGLPPDDACAPSSHTSPAAISSRTSRVTVARFSPVICASSVRVSGPLRRSSSSSVARLRWRSAGWSPA